MIRLIRIMEYIYETPEDMTNDVIHWEVPANGSKRFNPRETIHSAVLPFEIFGDKGVSDVGSENESLSESSN